MQSVANDKKKFVLIVLEFELRVSVLARQGSTTQVKPPTHDRKF
jgi:hypothetical protein